MEFDIKQALNQTKKGAAKGVTTIKKAAQNRAVGINNTFKKTTDNVRRSIGTDRAIKVIKKGINELRRDQAAAVPSKNIEKWTDEIIQKLEYVSQHIKSDPKGSITHIDALVAEFNESGERMVKEKQMVVVEKQIMLKRYMNVMRACKKAETILKNIE